MADIVQHWQMPSDAYRL